jgi:DNA-binding NtrC family response regulator
MKFNILIIDDEKNIREGLSASLEMEGYNTVLAENGKQGLELFAKGDIDLVITDLRMPEVTGEQVMQKILSENPGVPVIVLTGHGSIDSAVDAMRLGAYDFLTKPLNLDRLTLIVKRALQGRELSLQHRHLQEELNGKKVFESIVGKSSQMQKVFEMIKRVADSKASVLITGESGVGKELIANAIHNLSSRKEKPLIRVHCAALTETLLESELFGHEKGSFSGAVARKRGRFELANGGTIFLDEIGEINQNVQIKLLRVLQDKKFERVGGEETIEVDVRVVAATNKNLLEEIKKGNFREDLYYRLNVVHIEVPPLRERKEDIPLLVADFIKTYAKENGKNIEGIDATSIQNNLFNKAKKHLESLTFEATTKEEVEKIMNEHPGFVKADWCGELECELKMKEIKGTKSRCILEHEKPLTGKCVMCGKEAKHLVVWGIQY